MIERNTIILKITAFQILLPIATVIGAIDIRADLFLMPIIAQLLLIIVWFAGYWEFLNRKYKAAFFVVLELTLLLSLYRKLSYPVHHVPTKSLALLCFITGYLAVNIFRIVLVIFFHGKEKIEISFPLKNGKYLISDGGDSRISRLMNYHFHAAHFRKRQIHNSMAFAVDIVKMTEHPLFMGEKNEEYPIFGEDVFSPIDGEIIKVENEFPDNIPFQGKYPFNTGNTVVIRQGEVYLLLGHLMRGSIVVTEGQMVLQGAKIAQVGNSGFSERPHLHTHAMKAHDGNYWKGRGVNMVYNGGNLFKNKTIVSANIGQD